MNGARGLPHRLGHPFCRASRRRRQNDIQLPRQINVDKRTDNCRFTDARSARDNGKLILQAPRECLGLPRRQMKARMLFPPLHRLRGIDGAERNSRRKYLRDGLHGIALSPIKGTAVNAPSIFARAFRNDAAVGKLQFECLTENLHRDFRQFVCPQKKVVLKSPAMSAIIGFCLKGIVNGSARPQKGVLGYAHRERNAVRRREAHPPNVAAKAVRIRLDDGDGIGSVATDNLRHSIDGNPVGLPKNHRVSQTLIRVPTLPNLGDFRTPQLRHFP